MRVLLAIVDAQQSAMCGISFAVSMLRLQSALNTVPHIQATIAPAPTLREAARFAVAEGFDAVVAVEASVGFPVPFVLTSLLAPHEFVTGIYPLPLMNWDRVASARSAEDVRFKGNTYNVDLIGATTTVDGFLRVQRAALGAVVLKRDAIAALAACPTDSHEDLCAAWGKGIFGNLENPCNNTGSIEFAGCVGARVSGN